MTRGVAVLRPSTPLEVVAWERDIDLRTVSHQAKFLKSIAKRYNLVNGQTVLYSNTAWDRFRAVMVVNGLPVLILFPVDETYELRKKLFEQVAEWLTHTYRVRASVQKGLHAVFDREEYQRKVA